MLIINCSLSPPAQDLARGAVGSPEDVEGFVEEVDVPSLQVVVRVLVRHVGLGSLDGRFLVSHHEDEGAETPSGDGDGHLLGRLGNVDVGSLAEVFSLIARREQVRAALYEVGLTLMLYSVAVVSMTMTMSESPLM